MQSSFLIKEKTVKKAHEIKNTREKHTGQAWGQALIFTYRHWCDCLTDNKRQRLVSATVSQQIALVIATVSQHIALVGATISGLSALIEVAKEK